MSLNSKNFLVCCRCIKYGTLPSGKVFKKVEIKCAIVFGCKFVVFLFEVFLSIFYSATDPV